MNRMRIPLTVLALICANVARADSPAIEAVTFDRAAGSYRFDVTLSHPDTGWDHYADGWTVLDAEGQQLGHRTLAHPHVEEQPFTRSLSGVKIDKQTDQVIVRATCSHGDSVETTVSLRP